MPQLDIYSFAPVINWLIIIIFIFYIISVVKGLGVLNKILNYRRRSLEKKREGKEEQEEEGYYVGKKKGIKGENNVIKGGRVKEVEEVMNERKKVGSMSISLVISEIDGVEIGNNLGGIRICMMLVTGVAVLIVIYKFLVLKENEEFGHISEGSSENSMPVVLQGSPGVPSGGNGDDDPDNDKKKKKAKEEEERKEKEKAAKNTGVSWGWWACGALLVVVIIGGIIYYYWSEGESPSNGNGGDKGNPSNPPKNTGGAPTGNKGGNSGGDNSKIHGEISSGHMENGAKVVGAKVVVDILKNTSANNAISSTSVPAEATATVASELSTITLSSEESKQFDEQINNLMNLLREEYNRNPKGKAINIIRRLLDVIIYSRESKKEYTSSVDKFNELDKSMSLVVRKYNSVETIIEPLDLLEKSINNLKTEGGIPNNIEKFKEGVKAVRDIVKK